MPDKKEARRAANQGAQRSGSYTGSIPRDDFERGCMALSAMFVAFMAFVTVWEVVLR